jgi:hypothetical protein
VGYSVITCFFPVVCIFQHTVTRWLQEDGQDAQGGDDGEAIRLCDLSVSAVSAEVLPS